MSYGKDYAHYKRYEEEKFPIGVVKAA